MIFLHGKHMVFAGKFYAKTSHFLVKYVIRVVIVRSLKKE